jgi:NAD(P)-dependent dehydrogenase (short-subunit alcohol dehydrogenase family)
MIAEDANTACGWICRKVILKEIIMETKKVWFITGASKGLGNSLVKRLLNEGYAVAATSRTREALLKSVPEHPRFLPLEMNLSDEKSVAKAVAATKNKFGRIDVVVNNAGFGQGGSVEEVSDKEARENFDVNVFGLLNVIRGVGPVLRAQKSGHIFNISSIGGFVGGFSGWGVYCATKFAVAGLTEALSADMKRFGVHATVVYPGYFRTNFLESDSMKVPANPIADYFESQQSMKQHTEVINRHQPGDPEKAAEAMIKVAEENQPPVHLFLGSDAYGMAHQKLQGLSVEVERTKSITLSTDY